jgi:hypothetical protein
MIERRCLTIATAIVGLLAWNAQALSSEMIYSVGEGVACRDANGKIEEPSATVKARTPADAAPFGMVKVKDKVNRKDCYFYRAEVSLEPPESADVACSDSSVAQNKSSIAGTRNVPDCVQK